MLQQFKYEDKQELFRARKEYRERRGTNNDVQSLQRTVQELQSTIAGMTSGSPTGTVPGTVSADSSVGHVSQITTDTDGRTVMGGRNERAAIRRNPDGSRI